MTAEKLSTGGAYGAENERKRGKTAACADANAKEDSKASAGGGDGDDNGGADLCAAQAGYTVSIFKGGCGSLTSESYTEKWAEVICALASEGRFVGQASVGEPHCEGEKFYEL